MRTMPSPLTWDHPEAGLLSVAIFCLIVLSVTAPAVMGAGRICELFTRLSGFWMSPQRRNMNRINDLPARYQYGVHRILVTDAILPGMSLFALLAISWLLDHPDLNQSFSQLRYVYIHDPAIIALMAILATLHISTSLPAIGLQYISKARAPLLGATLALVAYA